MSEPKTSEPKMVTTAVIISLVAGILIILGGLYTTAILVFSIVSIFAGSVVGFIGSILGIVGAALALIVKV